MSLDVVGWKESFHITADELSLLKKDVECVICDDLSDNEKDFTLTSCGHVSHIGCLCKWFQKAGQQTCPKCRTVCDFIEMDYVKMYKPFQYDGPRAVKDGRCAICETNERKPYATLVCGHEWHFDCITGWMTKRRVCPFCCRRIAFSKEQNKEST